MKSSVLSFRLEIIQGASLFATLVPFHQSIDQRKKKKKKHFTGSLQGCDVITEPLRDTFVAVLAS